MRKNKKGFTLVELVIVIAVIAILAAVLLPTFSSVIENAKVSSATQQATNSLKDYFARVSTVSTEDTVDTMDDLKGYVIVVDNGAGAGDYLFVVGEGGKLGDAIKVNHTISDEKAVKIVAKNSEDTLPTMTADWKLIKLGEDADGKIGNCYIYISDVTATDAHYVNNNDPAKAAESYYDITIAE